MPYDSSLPRVHTFGSDEGGMQHNELMDLVTKLSDRVVALENRLSRANKVYEIQGRHGQEMYFETKVYTAEDVSTVDAAVTTAGASISTASPLRVSTTEDISTTKTLVYIRKRQPKYKGKAKMDESKPEKTKTKLQQKQERVGYEPIVRLQEQLDEEERKRIAKVHEEASSFNIEEWEDIQAIIKADEELAQRIQAEEREKYSEAKKARLLAELINQRK
ncbi:hypothetical protein Tco_1084175 [Tanacetum coccineum]